MNQLETKELSVIDRGRESHHAVARMVAAGMSWGMIRRNTGYTYRRLAILANSPSFQELVGVYSKRYGEKFDEAVDAYTDASIGNMLRSELTVTDHFEAAEAAGELIPIMVANRISQDRADRFGYSKHVKHEHTHDFAALLDRAIERSGKREALLQLEGEALSPFRLSPPPASPSKPGLKRRRLG